MFQKDFLFGGALAAQQCEGSCLGGFKGDSVSDHLSAGSKCTPRIFTKNSRPDFRYPSHIGTQFSVRYKEDIRMLSEIGIKALRLSISWAKIYPNGCCDPDESGLQFYDDLFDECLKYHIEPVVTICHNDMPYILSEQYDGWYSRELIDLYVQYSVTVMERYKSKVKYWLPFNELNSGMIENVGMFLACYFKDVGDSFDIHKIPDVPAIRFQSLHHMMVASARTVIEGRKINPDFQFGAMLLSLVNYPYSCNPSDVLLSMENEEIIVDYCADVLIHGEYSKISQTYLQKKNILLQITDSDHQILKAGTVDFCSFSYYSSSTACSDSRAKTVYGNLIGGNKNPYLSESEWGWTMDPDGLYYFLHKMYCKYKIPLMIVENGLGSTDILEKDNSIHDSYRIEYVRSHLRSVEKALEDGIEILGYLAWGIIDLVSASTGEMKKRYGFIYVDADDEGNGTYDRYKKDSFYWYKKVIASNGADLD